MKELSTGHILGKGGYSIVREISVVTLFKPKSRENSTKHFGNVLRSSMCRRNSFGSSAGYRRNSNDFSNVARTYPMRESNFEFPNQEPQDPSCESTGAESFDWDEDEMMKQVHDRAFIANHCMRGGEARYAVKKLHSSYDTDPRQHFNGIVDLAVEARFLAFVRHPNIIRLRAMSLGDPYKPGFFILMDRLYDTLVRFKVLFMNKCSPWIAIASEINSICFDMIFFFIRVSGLANGANEREKRKDLSRG